jgi:hypothetical protein
MHAHSPTLYRLSRVCLLALLVLGMMIEPVLAQLSELHAAEHATEVTADVHDHGHETGDTHHGGDPEQDDHASGTHGLMHQSGGCSTLTGPVAGMSVPEVYARTPDLPIPDTIGVPHAVPSSPFRPPIV